ncbi:uncharacterized protein MKZ38_001662 [Zalerion maritima]|uniref:Fumarylacetoacetase n=1 Tax=Zalerion maritima TaxID=339359 RepID=A0AAD5RQ21_9PEZI|nr:uncharacterized protein MKZ38_001662 [Zalerion maritima]
MAQSSDLQPAFVDPECGFDIHNLPFCIYNEGHLSSDAASRARIVGCRIGHWVINLHSFADHKEGLFAEPAKHWDERTKQILPEIRDALKQPTLNAFASLGPEARKAVREVLQRELSSYKGKDDVDHILSPLGPFMSEVENVTLYCPFKIGDYTDFYAGIHHAEGVGKLFRPKGKALQDNYTHIPVGYHGRSSTVVVSDTPIRRPAGPILVPSNSEGTKQDIIVSPTRKLDYEVELGCFVGKGNAMGTPIPISEASSHIFGYVLLNDWSARDIQAFEYVPLGPFNGKNFATSVSPWVVTPEALEHAVGAGVQHPDHPEKLQPYLREPTPGVLNATITTSLTRAEKNWPTTGKLSRVDTSTGLLWSFPQMIAHHTVGGCSLRPGDLLGSGTISGPPDKPIQDGLQTKGSLLEITKNGVIPIPWRRSRGSGEEKEQTGDNTFLRDGDVVTMSAIADHRGTKISFGEVIGRVIASSQS